MKILLLPGDGIGQEIVEQAVKILSALQQMNVSIEFDYGLIGGSAIDKLGSPLPQQTIDQAEQSDALLLGAVGGPKWESLPIANRPEKGLLGLRKHFELFANLRPALLYPQLADASTLKAEVVKDLDILIVRELTGGIYFGQPRGIEVRDGEKCGFNTYIYKESEIRRIARVAFELAMKRNKKICSVDKANVLEVTEFWREIVTDESKNYPEVSLSHMYVDNACMQLIRAPKAFDVILTGNMFGDILSDAAAMLTGSIGMLPSASLNSKQFGLYEPVHGSAPDIAGQDSANPLATILSLAMMLRYSFNEPVWANKIEQAVKKALDDGYRTPDIAAQNTNLIGTEAMGSYVQKNLLNQSD